MAFDERVKCKLRPFFTISLLTTESSEPDMNLDKKLERLTMLIQQRRYLL